MFDKISELVGVPEDQVKLMSLILMSYPISIINFQLKDRLVRLWFGLLTGLWLQYIMYGYRKFFYFIKFRFDSSYNTYISYIFIYDIFWPKTFRLLDFRFNSFSFIPLTYLSYGYRFWRLAIRRHNNLYDVNL